MNVGTERLVIEGPAGAIEVARDVPSGGAQGVALIAHPHPLFGGTLDNKVVQTVARAAVQKGWTAIRFNFLVFYTHINIDIYTQLVYIYRIKND